ncbi:MAG: hypothetical protein MSH31_06015 [Clostridiales bacterium]|nr:hypothetical protein [Clostridiales bacterium]
MGKRTLALLLLAAMLAACAAKDNTTIADTENPAVDTESVPEVTETTEVPDLPADLSFDGATFTFGVVDNPNGRNPIVMEELTGEALNDAQYNTVQQTNDALNVLVAETILTGGYPAAQDVIKLVTAGDDVIQVANIYCAAIPQLLSGGYVMSYNDVPYIDLRKTWWDQKVSENLVISDIRYAVNGHLNITTHDLTYCLVFSKDQIADNGLENPYDLVRDGKWTMDKMAEQMVAVTRDANGDGTFDEKDNYGYASAIKMTLPSFWIGAGEKTITLNDAGIPSLTMDSERFHNVIEKIFAITYDNGTRYQNKADDYDIPTECKDLFVGDRALFMDCSLFYVAALRDMETDFGILPYPKYDEAQTEYCSRVSYFMPAVMPATNRNLELVGAVLEYINYRAKENITPAYYDITLKGKVSRDEESVEMLDIILDNRVVDLGDTLFCASVRDGFFTAMYRSNNHDLASVLQKNEASMQKAIDDMVAGMKAEKE